MIIDKNNIELIRNEELNLHDLILQEINCDMINRKVKIDISRNIEITLFNVVDMVFLNKSEYYSYFVGEINDWEEIPNAVNKDNYIFAKESFLKEGGVWNDNLFAILFFFSDTSEFKVICEKIEFNKVGESL